MEDCEAAEHVRDVARFHFQRYVPPDDLAPLDILGAVAKAHGITIRSQLESPQLRAVGVELADGCQYIIYNSRLVPDLQAFYIAHELFHLVAEDPEGWDECREVAADLYAVTLLQLVSRRINIAFSPRIPLRR